MDCEVVVEMETVDMGLLVFGKSQGKSVNAKGAKEERKSRKGRYPTLQRYNRVEDGAPLRA